MKVIRNPNKPTYFKTGMCYITIIVILTEFQVGNKQRSNDWRNSSQHAEYQLNLSVGDVLGSCEKGCVHVISQCDGILSIDV